MSEEKGKTEKFTVNIDESDYDKPYVAPPLVVEKKEEKKKKRKKRRWLRNLIWATVIVTLSTTLAITIMLFVSDMYSIAGTDNDVEIDFPQGAVTEDIANILHENGIIEYPLGFRLVSKLSGADGTFNYGAYTLNTSDSYATIIEKLQVPSTRHVETVTVTFKEGLTLGQMADVAAESGVCTREQFLKACEKEYDCDFEQYMQQNSLRLKKYEGYLFPDTYEFFVDDTAEIMVRRMLIEFQNRVATPLHSKIADSGMTFDQVITLASIVQAEAGATDQMSGVAGVFRNRLDIPERFPRLESDPTKLYSRTVVAFYSSNQEQIKSYNTYESFGLPPGPIGNPSYEAVMSVLDPEKSDYFYFCHNINTKEVFYGKTLAEHEQNLYKAGIW